MLSAKETAALIEILARSGDSLEASSNAFMRAFVRSDHFRVAAAMCIMLEDDLMPASHRLTALYIIHDLYKNESAAVHPFTPFLVAMVEAAAAPPPEGDEPRVAERNLLSSLLSKGATAGGGGSATDVPKMSPAELAALWKAGAAELPLPDLAALRASYAERDARVPALRRAGVSPLVADPQPLEPASSADAGASGVGGAGAEGGGGGADAGPSGASAWDGLVALEKPLGLLRLEPGLLRPPPPLLEASEDELLWLLPHGANTFELLWDHSMCADNVKGAEVRDLMGRAFRGPLVPAQQQQVLSELESDAKLVYHCGLTPKRLPDLVENNPVIAIEVLLKLMSSSQITDYFSV